MEKPNLESESDFTKKALEDASLENPLNKIEKIREHFSLDLEKPVEFKDDENNTSSLLYFSEKLKNGGEDSHFDYIKEFPEIIKWRGGNMLPGGTTGAKEFWSKLHAENGKSFKNMLDKMEQLLLEFKGESK